MKKLNKINQSSYNVMDFSQMDLIFGGEVAKKTEDTVRSYPTCPGQYGCNSGDTVIERQPDAGGITVTDICWDTVRIGIQTLRPFGW